jgi:hypothetical protein
MYSLPARASAAGVPWMGGINSSGGLRSVIISIIFGVSDDPLLDRLLGFNPLGTW